MNWSVRFQSSLHGLITTTVFPTISPALIHTRAVKFRFPQFPVHFIMKKTQPLGEVISVARIRLICSQPAKREEETSVTALVTNFNTQKRHVAHRQPASCWTFFCHVMLAKSLTRFQTFLPVHHKKKMKFLINMLTVTGVENFIKHHSLSQSLLLLLWLPVKGLFWDKSTLAYWNLNYSKSQSNSTTEGKSSLNQKGNKTTSGRPWRQHTT